MALKKDSSQNKMIWLGISGLVLVALGYVGYQYWKSGYDTFEIPSSGDQSEEQTIQINRDGIVEEKTIHVTNGTRHTVPLEEIRSGGPPKDGIPPIDDPKFISVEEASKDVTDEDRGVAIDIDGVKRFYPFDVLVWHEIVNDTVNGERVLITYCPLCLSAFVFDPVVDGEKVEFGTSGKLWNSNLVMYDRKTDTLWSQILGEAIVGEKTGEVLDLLPSDLLFFKDWKTQNPDGEVLSRDTGATRFYGSDPYGEGFISPFPVNKEDDRLEKQAFVMGVVINKKAKAYVPEDIKEVGVLEDVVGGEKISVEYDSNLDVMRFYKIAEDGSKERFNPFNSFWFSWAAVHPDTDLYEKL